VGSPVHRDDEDKDLIAGTDGTPNNPRLYIWDTDAPRIGRVAVPNNGDIQRVRFQFLETVTYAGVPVSPTLPWYWASSQVNANGAFNQYDDPNVVGDNSVSVGTIDLTWGLLPSDVPDFTVTGFTARINNQPVAVVTAGTNNVAFTIDGTGLTAGGAANAPQITLAYLYQENTSSPFGWRKQYMPLNITQQTANAISGTFNVQWYNPVLFTPTGWKLVLMIGGKAVSYDTSLRIND
jgi:hypothetical protein